MRFLIVKSSALGDILHAFPVLNYLKERFPHCRIDWIVEDSAKSLLKAHPLLDQVISFNFKQLRKNPFSSLLWKKFFDSIRNCRKNQYDLLIDLQGNTKSAFFSSFVNAKQRLSFARPYLPEWPHLYLKALRFCPPKGFNIYQDLLYIVQKYFKESPTAVHSKIELMLSKEEKKCLQRIDFSPELKILIAPFSTWENKQLDFSQLAFFLEKVLQDFPQAFFYIIWGSVDEKAKAKQIQKRFGTNSYLLEKLSLPLLQRVVAQLDCVLSMDSLPLHLAASTSKPVFGLFGPSSMRKYHQRENSGFQGHCPFSQSFEKRCKFLRTCDKAPCMKEMDLEAAYRAFKCLLENKVLNH